MSIAGPSHRNVSATALAAQLKGRRGSAAKSAESTDTAVDTIEVENFGPPAWRTVLNKRADLGYPDFYPSRPGFHQPEDVLTEENVKNGYQAKSYVALQAEGFSMHGPIYKHLIANGGLEAINQLAMEVLAKRDEGMPKINERAFRLPVRVTYTDARRAQFLVDLANPLIPLHRLMRMPVPYGFKGVELLDAMFNPVITPSSGPPKPRPTPDPVPVERAVWFIRILGANEIVAHRGRAQPALASVAAPSPVPATPSSTATLSNISALPLSSNDWYTQEFTNTLTTWLRIQLGQLTVPKSSIEGASPAKPVAGVFTDEKFRTRWTAKWEYGLALLLKLKVTRLLSNRMFTSWLSDQLASSNLVQLPFLSRLVALFLPEMARHVINGRQCIRALCSSLLAIQGSTAMANLENVASLLRTLIRSLYNANPEIIFSPRGWRLHAEVLTSILKPSDEASTSLDTGGAQFARPQTEARHLNLWHQPVPTRTTVSRRKQQMDEIQRLDSICAETVMPDLCKAYFDGNSAPGSPNLDVKRLREKISTILNWSMGLFQLGFHRPYAVYTMLKVWHEKHHKSKARSSDLDLFPILYEWLDKSPAAQRAENVQAIGITFGELTRAGLFSYGRYMQTLIAKGHTARSRTHESPTSHHLAILRVLPIFVDTKDLLQQRRIALCGDDRRLRQLDQQEEEQAEEAYIEEIREYVPEIFGFRRYGKSAQLRNGLHYDMSSSRSMTRHRFVHARFRVFPAAVQHLTRQGPVPPMDTSTFCRIVDVFRQGKGGSTTADFLLKALQLVQDKEVLAMTVNAVRRDADIWTAMDRWHQVIDTVMDRIQSLRERDQYNVELMGLLLDLAKQGRLPADDLAEVESIRKEHDEAKPPATAGWSDAKDSMGQLQSIVSSGDSVAATGMADKLLFRHGPFAKWGDIWWPSVVEASQSPKLGITLEKVFDATVSHATAMDELSERGLDSVIAAWLNNMSPQARIDVFGQASSNHIVSLLLTLAAGRRASSVTLLEGLVYNAWKQAATICLGSRARLSAGQLRMVEAAVTICQQLLLTVPPSQKLPPQTLCEAVILQTSRAQAFSNSHITLLIRHLPYLVILERSAVVWQRTREQITSLLHDLANTPEFKNAAFRHIDLLKDVFLSNEWNKTHDLGLEAGMVEALKLMMSDPTTNERRPSTAVSLDARFSAWRWTRIVLEMRVEFKRLALVIENAEDPTVNVGSDARKRHEEAVGARQTLSRLVQETFDRNATADDMDLICEAFRGIEPIVIQEILVAGLDRLTALLSQVVGADHQFQLEHASAAIDLVLTILSSSTGPIDKLKVENNVLHARHRLLDMVSVALQSVERQFASRNEQSHVIEAIAPPRFEDAFKVTVKLLKYALGINADRPGVNASPGPDFARLAVAFLRVIVALPHPSREGLVDTLIHIVDMAPGTGRVAVQNALLAEIPSAAVQAALAATPSLVRALPVQSPQRRPLGLTRLDPLQESNDLVDAALIHLDDRPWENMEHLQPPPEIKKHNDPLLLARPIKDTGSVPLSFFDPHVCADLPPASPSTPEASEDGDGASNSDSEPNWWDFTSERNLGEGLAGEPLAAREVAGSLYAGTADREKEPGPKTPRSTAVGLGISLPDQITSADRGRRMSQRLATNPMVTPGGSTRPVPPSTTATTTTGKKDNPITIDEDESSDDSSPGEEESAPPTKRPKTGGKTVGSKAPRKTTGGKNMGRKASVGGKSTRKGVKR